MKTKTKTKRKPRAIEAAQLEQAIASMGGMGVIKRTFHFMGLAEEEIARAFPRKADEPKGLFGALIIPLLLRDKADQLYVSHVRELCSRAKAGEKLAPATKAECLASLLAASLKAPLNTEGMMMAERLFIDVFGKLPPGDTQPARFAQEQWAGQYEEALSQARRTCRVEERNIG